VFRDNDLQTFTPNFSNLLGVTGKGPRKAFDDSVSYICSSTCPPQVETFSTSIPQRSIWIVRCHTTAGWSTLVRNKRGSTAVYKIMHRTLVFLGVVSFSASSFAFAQQSTLLASAALADSSSQQPTGSVALYRYGDLLRLHGVELTVPALVAALKNADASVRYLAAMKLAEDKVTDAVPAIEQALATEKLPRDRVNLALALGLLGDQLGRDELTKICADKGFVPEFRLYAVRYMFDLHVPKNGNCMEAAQKIAESRETDFGDRSSALELLSQFGGLTPEESQKVAKLVGSCLEDPEPSVRIRASQSLARLGDPTGVEYLETAIAKESEETVRSVFEKDLKKLQLGSRP
jgi:HEAT repeats